MAFTTIQGSGANDATSFVGTSGVDSIALADSTGNYYLEAEGAADVISLVTTGNPLYTRVVNNTTLKGGQGNDIFTYTSANATTNVSAWLNGNAGNDTFTLAAGDTFLSSTLQGGEGNDSFTGAANVSAGFINGNKGNDTINFGAGVVTNSSLFGGQGNDGITLAGGASNSSIDGALGNDTVTITAGTLTGTSIGGGDGIDVINLTGAGVTNTTVFVNGNAGTDTITGPTLGNASLFGGQGVDTITSIGTATAGTPSNTTIVGGIGEDIITGSNTSIDRIYYTGYGQGAATVSATNATVYVGDAIGTVQAADFFGLATSIIAGSTNVAAATAQNGWNLNNVGVAVIAGTTGGTVAANNAAAIAVKIGTVTGDAGDTAYVAITDANDDGTADTVLAQVTLGSAKAGAALNGSDTITILGTITGLDVAAGQFQFI